MASNGLLLVEESTAVIVSGGRRETRPAHFLLPRAAGDRPLPALPSSLRRNAGPVAEEELQVDLKGWPVFSTTWARWVDKLREKHEQLWMEVGILDAVVASKYRLWREESVLLQAAALWSSGNNTFVFPWGEATVTLEDVAVLGGMPLLGQPVYSELSDDDLRRDVEALEAVRKAMNRSKSKKANPPRWTKHFLDRPEEEEEGREAAMALLEHGAFLSMWLSIYVLPAPPISTIHPFMFPLAARLARGLRVALAPAVLASIYNGVSALKHHIDHDGDARHPLTVTAPLYIVQLWLWERFPELRPGQLSVLTNTTSNISRGGASRAARWRNIRRTTTALAPGYIRAVFMSPEVFNWNPSGTTTQELQSSMAPCLRPQLLVGVGITEQYNPHRVARQLGFDQDVPATVIAATPVSGGGTTNARAFYDLQENEDVTSIFVPSRDPGVTAEYARWWEPHSSSCAADVANAMRTKRLMLSINLPSDQFHGQDHHQERQEDDHSLNEVPISRSGTNSEEEGAFQPRRGTGTAEMIKQASEARQAEKIELEEKIAALKKDIWG